MKSGCCVQKAKKNGSEMGVTGTHSDELISFSTDTGTTKACHWCVPTAATKLVQRPSGERRGLFRSSVAHTIRLTLCVAISSMSKCCMGGELVQRSNFLPSGENWRGI